MTARAPRCKTQRCGKRAEIADLCISHAERLADKRFSAWVRDRDGRCTGVGVLPGQCHGVLQAAHGIGRANHTTRYDPQNVASLCQAHHVLVDQKGREQWHWLWLELLLGEDAYEQLMYRAQQVTKRRDAVGAALAWLPEGEGT